MSHKIQLVVDDQFNEVIQSGAKKMGLSVSSFARLILKNALQGGSKKLLNQALEDIQSNAVEEITLHEFKKNIF